MKRESDNNENNSRELRTESVITEEDWLIKAIEQKSAHLTVGVANSKLMVYDQIDRHLLSGVYGNSRN